jgi:hypothetical protein
MDGTGRGTGEGERESTERKIKRKTTKDKDKDKGKDNDKDKDKRQRQRQVVGWAGGWLPDSRRRRCQKSTNGVHGFDANQLVSKRQAVKVHVDVSGTAMARRSSPS